nr:HD domain-containing protein [Methylomonas koyamae]
MDTTYIPLAKGFAYLTAVVDWASRKVLAAKVAITLEACHAAVAALLHDAVEDAETTDEANRRRDLIREAFGERVATIVEGYTDARQIVMV